MILGNWHNLIPLTFYCFIVVDLLAGLTSSPTKPLFKKASFNQTLFSVFPQTADEKPGGLSTCTVFCRVAESKKNK